MFKVLKFGVIVFCFSVAIPTFASPLGPLAAPKKSVGKHHGHGRMIPARHNAGRPMHA